MSEQVDVQSAKKLLQMLAEVAPELRRAGVLQVALPGLTAHLSPAPLEHAGAAAATADDDVEDDLDGALKAAGMRRRAQLVENVDRPDDEELAR